MARRLSDEQRDLLASETDHFAAQAGNAFLDGELEAVAALSARAIRADDTLFLDDPGDSRVAAVYAERLRNDAEVCWQWGMLVHAHGQTDSATQQLERGATSAETAIDLYERGDVTDAGRYPLLVPSIRLLWAELITTPAGQPALGETLAREALIAYRAECDPAEPRSAVMLAHALARHAIILDRAGQPDDAQNVRRTCLDVGRAHLGPGGPLWDRRHDRPTWASTPSMKMLGQTAVSEAMYLAPPRPDTVVAREALEALQDGFEALVALVPGITAPMLLPDTREIVWIVTRVGLAAADWLGANGHAELAERYRTTLGDLTRRPGADWWPAVRELRSRSMPHFDEAQVPDRRSPAISMIPAPLIPVTSADIAQSRFVPSSEATPPTSRDRIRSRRSPATTHGAPRPATAVVSSSSRSPTTTDDTSAGTWPAPSGP